MARPKIPRYTGDSAALRKAWTAMRILRRFTQPDIIKTSGIGEGFLKLFCRRLVASGYLVIAKARINGYAGQYHTYSLVRDTGPLYPIAWKNGSMWDQNTRREFDDEGNDVTPKLGAWRNEA